MLYSSSLLTAIFASLKEILDPLLIVLRFEEDGKDYAYVEVVAVLSLLIPENLLEKLASGKL